MITLPQGVSRALALLVLACATACGGGGDDDGDDDPFDPGSDTEIPPVTSGTWYRPPVATTWQWQLQGDVNIAYDVALYELDLFETPASVISALKASGRRLLCYFSAGSWEDFRPDAGQFPSSALCSVYS
ncbi:MAG: endo alpha-1,4 polygalactosaminidase, partial [Longimicrobiales bacterium]